MSPRLIGPAGAAFSTAELRRHGAPAVCCVIRGSHDGQEHDLVEALRRRLGRNAASPVLCTSKDPEASTQQKDAAPQLVVLARVKANG